MKLFFAFFSLLFLLHGFFPLYSQVDSSIVPIEENIEKAPKEKPTYNRKKGTAYFYWGYNRSAFTNSNIRFKGSDYDFTIKNVKGSDAPTKEFGTYVNPSSFSVPQYDWRIGYFITDKYSVSFGHAHMKYEIEDQVVKMTGTISNGEFAGEYNDTPIRVGEEDNVSTNTQNGYPTGIVSKLEHCDGLNNFTFEFARRDNLWVSRNGKHCLSFELSVGVGASVTDTESEVLGVSDPNHGDQSEANEHAHEGGADEHGGSWNGFHLAGYTTSLSTSIQLEFFNHFFIQTRLKGGYVNLTNFITTHDGGRGSQQLGFVEGFIAVGYTFQLFK
ncbi:MAG: hypothetical protein COA97_02680 [Flavobacteriales bacterium]|nr:MAG: hypothetical protein COA97_02680 [Flavobacteriales bacterium]